jgi:thioredoxin-related protein
MKLYHCLLLIFLLTLLSSFKNTKRFPEITEPCTDGRIIQADFFEGKRTLVIMAHLGCPPAMQLLKDLQSDSSLKFQTLLVLENSLQQVNDFNALDKNDWSGIRNHFGLMPMAMTTIAECKETTQKSKNNNMVAGSECRKLSKKIRTKDSPTLVFVNEKREMVKIQKGYSGAAEKQQRMKVLLDWPQ